MSELVFATFAKELKSAFRKRKNDPDLIMLLYDAVALPVELRNQNNDTITISKTKASNIMNRKAGANVLDCIREHSYDAKVIDNIEVYFSDCVVSELHDGKINPLLKNITSLIRNDTIIDDTTRNKLLNYASEEYIAKFLGETLLYTLSVTNVLTKNEDDISVSDTNPDENKQHPLPLLVIPYNIENDERKYITALIEVYAEETGKMDFKLDDLSAFPKQKNILAASVLIFLPLKHSDVELVTFIMMNMMKFLMCF